MKIIYLKNIQNKGFYKQVYIFNPIYNKYTYFIIDPSINYFHITNSPKYFLRNITR